MYETNNSTPSNIHKTFFLKYIVTQNTWVQERQFGITYQGISET